MMICGVQQARLVLRISDGNILEEGKPSASKPMHGMQNLRLSDPMRGAAHAD